MKEMLLGGQPQPVSRPTPSNPGATDGYIHKSSDETDSVPQDISVSDLIIMQASFDCKLLIIILIHAKTLT